MIFSISTPTPAPVPPQIHIVASSDSSPLFSLQDALTTYSGGIYDRALATQTQGTLFRSGCLVDGILNCTAACQDVNQIFADPHTFQNCMVVASLMFLSPIVTLDASSTALAEEFSIHTDQPGIKSLAIGVNQTIQDCLIQYLDNSSGQYDSRSSWYSDNSSVGNDRWDPWYLELDDLKSMSYPSFPSICDNLTAVSLNADVGGIGVRKSHRVYRGQCLSMAGLHLLLASSRHLPLSFPGAENLR